MLLLCKSCKNIFKTSDRAAKYCSRECCRIAFTGRTLPREQVEKMVASRKGYRHSEETKEKIRLSNIGKIVSDETRKKQSAWQLGRKMPSEVVRKAAESHRGIIPWNKGLTAQTDVRVRLIAEKQAGIARQKKQYPIEIHTCVICGNTFETGVPLGISVNRKTCSKGCMDKLISSKVKGKWVGRIPWNKGIPCTEGTKRKMGIKIRDKIRQKWEDPEYAHRVLSAIFKANNTLPNKAEQKLDKFLQENFPNEWKYTGDGDIIIGGKNPDFVNINGRKQLIELYGNYWHKDDNPQERIDFFKQYGFNTLVVWEKELKNNILLLEKLKTFCSGVT